ncbi:hypothetical protein D7Y57_05615 [Stenotrophomonas maltophilia]|nr:hypothetical protein DF40_018945 [Stenotrophomonas maltophilia M30]MBA0455618.1 hypothetical protein [Stenotrophomonas maltophilia]
MQTALSITNPLVPDLQREMKRDIASFDVFTKLIQSLRVVGCVPVVVKKHICINEQMHLWHE